MSGLEYELARARVVARIEVNKLAARLGVQGVPLVKGAAVIGDAMVAAGLAARKAARLMDEMRLRGIAAWDKQTCILCRGEGRLDTDEGGTVVCVRCAGTGDEPRPAMR